MVQALRPEEDEAEKAAKPSEGNDKQRKELGRKACNTTAPKEGCPAEGGVRVAACSGLRAHDMLAPLPQ